MGVRPPTMSRIPDETVQQVLAATDIVVLISRYVKLKKSGANWSGLCPFHTEKSPSFSVSQSRNSYHCFGCGAGGTAIGFVMEQEGLSFPEAVRKLAEAAGIVIQEEVWDANTEREAKERSLLKRVHEEMAQFLHALLLKHAVAAPARDYLKSRGITSTVAKNWLLGYAPEQDIYMRQWAAEHKYSEAVMVRAGIFGETDNGRKYPRFRNRLMIPLRNETSECIGFSGRALAPGEKAKYVNSPETPIFTKGRMLFGFDKSKKAIGKEGYAIVLEGQLDLVTAYEAGVHNVCASQGTAFTEDHVRMLKRHAQEVVLCFDADSAGFKAAERSYQILAPAGFTVKVATLPKGEDPDSLIKSQGADVFRSFIAKAADFLDFQITHKQATMGNNLSQQVSLIEKIAVDIAMNPSVSARELMIRSHAAQLGVGEDAFRKQVAVFIKRQQRAAEEQRKNPLVKQVGSTHEPAPMTRADAAKQLLAAQEKPALWLAGMALTKAEVLEWLREQDMLPLLNALRGTTLLERVWRSSFDAEDEAARSTFFATLAPEEETAFTQLLARTRFAGGIPEAEDALKNLDIVRLQRAVQQATAKLKTPGLAHEEVDRINIERLALNQELLTRTRPTPIVPQKSP